MKKHENKKSSRRWVIRAMAVFLVVLALLTFFSNTIMNMTIPLVVTGTAMRGNLSYTNSATGQIVSDNQIEVKGLEGRTVSEVLVSNYDMVEEGDVLMTLVPVEDMSELDELVQSLLTAQRELEYAQRAPHHAPTYVAENQAIRTAEQALATAQTNLNNATTRDQTIAAAQQILSANQSAVAALQAQVASASASVEVLNTQLAALYAQLAVIDGTATVVIPTTVPTGMYAARPSATAGKFDPEEPAPAEPDTATDPNVGTVDPNAAVDGDPGEGTTTTTTAPSTSDTTPTTPSTTETLPPPTPTSDRQTVVNQIAQVQGQLADAQNRLSGYASQLAAAQTAVTAAQEVITTAEALPSTYAAQDAVADAQAALSAAQVALSDAQINAGIAADQYEDSIEDKERTIADLEDKIAKTRARLTQTEIVAPAAGRVCNITVIAGDKFQAEQVICVVVPSDSTYSVSFTFDTNVVQSYQVGQELTANYYFISKIVITNIKPDPNNPRDKRIVKCAVYSNGEMWPGETITVTADKGNATYDHVVPASAVSEDNSGNFVFVVDQSSGPLGDRYVVRRVAVSIQATSGSFIAINGEGLDNVMVVTRSEEPLHNGDRVRLEDYSGNSN